MDSSDFLRNWKCQIDVIEFDLRGKTVIFADSTKNSDQPSESCFIEIDLPFPTTPAINVKGELETVSNSVNVTNYPS